MDLMLLTGAARNHKIFPIGKKKSSRWAFLLAMVIAVLFVVASIYLIFFL